MKKPDELALWDAISTKAESKTVRDIVNELIKEGKISQGRANYILLKWSGKNLYEYGVCLDLGWLVKGAKFEPQS